MTVRSRADNDRLIEALKEEPATNSKKDWGNTHGE